MSQALFFLLFTISGLYRNMPNANQNIRHNQENPLPPEPYRNNDYQPRNRGRQNYNNRSMGFKTLEEIASADPLDVIAKLNERKESFLSLFTKPVEGDIHVLTIQILAKVSLSSFAELKLRIMLDICNSQFVLYLRDYLINLPYDDQRARQRNRFYWNNQDDFWKNLITFCECIFNLVPSVALQKLRSLIEGTTRSCLEELNSRHNFVLSERNVSKLRDLRASLTTFEMKKEVSEDFDYNNTHCFVTFI